MRIQDRNGLPDAIAEEKRFFELLGAGKDNTPTGWNKPENWKYLEDIPEDSTFGFAICNNTDYLFIDCDHVRDPKTGKLVPWVDAVIKRIFQYGYTYCEISMSGTGLHFICDLGDFAENFARESNGYDQIILEMDPEEYRHLTKEEKDKIPKIEFFYHADGRYVYLTGQHKQLYQVAKDEDAAAIFSELLEVRKEHHKKYAAKKYAEDDAKIGIDDATRARVLEALPYISANEREIWVKVGLALSNCGFDFDLWDTWSQFTDQRTGEVCDKYNPDETPKIWKSFKNTRSHWNAGTIIKLAKENGYAPKPVSLLLPEYSDVSQASLFISEYGEIVRYSKATGYLKYDGKVWTESELQTRRLAQELTERQLNEIRTEIWAARKQADDELESGSQDGTGKQALKTADHHRREILKRRTTQRIAATLTEAAPRLEVNVKELDADGYLLNTPGGTVDLRTGQIRQHEARDYCTKMTAVTPDQSGEDIWNEFLERLTVGDTDLSRYLQEVAGMCAIGAVKREELIIATGTGGNGKSTFFNTLFRVLGDYGGMLSAETLTTNTGKNKDPETAELRGRRMIIAAELEEGMRLDTATVKKLCSTDPIQAAKKYKDPFFFVPSHHIILYTNHLPKVGTNDNGTWDRLVIVPFRAKFRNEDGEIKDYATYLFQECGGAALQWIIEGAQRVISQGFMIEKPSCVANAIESYHEQSDWLSEFLETRCVRDAGYRTSAAILYQGYRSFCTDTGEYTRSGADFSKAMEDAGFVKHKTKKGKFYIGLRVKDFLELRREEADITGMM